MPYTEEYIKHLRRQRLLFMLINIVAAFSIGVLFWLIWNDHIQLRSQATTIQDQRYATILATCLDQNHRHDNTIVQLREIAHRLARHEGRKARKELKQSIKYNIILIDALVPKQPCRKLALLAVTRPPVKPPIHVKTTR